MSGLVRPGRTISGTGQNKLMARLCCPVWAPISIAPCMAGRTRAGAACWLCVFKLWRQGMRNRPRLGKEALSSGCRRQPCALRTAFSALSVPAPAHQSQDRSAYIVSLRCPVPKSQGCCVPALSRSGSALPKEDPSPHRLFRKVPTTSCEAQKLTCASHTKWIANLAGMLQVYSVHQVSLHCDN